MGVWVNSNLGKSVNSLECNVVFYLFYSLEFAKMPYRRPEMITYQEGDLIAARFPDDGSWYRARVLHVLEAEYKVIISSLIISFLNDDFV